MTARIEAIYHDGILQPRHPLPFADGAEVDVLVVADEAHGAREDLQRQQSPARILAEIAALQIEGRTDEFSGADHDKILYAGR